MRVRVALLLGLTASPLAAQQPDLSALIADTIGYVNVAPGIVILEGDEFDTFVCKIDVTEENFAAYAAGEMEAGAVGYTCIPIEEFEK